MYTADAQKCTEFSIAALKLKWNDMVKTLTDTQKIDIVKNIIVDIARYSPDVSAQLKSAFLIVEAHNSFARVTQQSIQSWNVIINLYPNLKGLKPKIRYDATAATDLARVFYGNAPLIAKSLLK